MLYDELQFVCNFILLDWMVISMILFPSEKKTKPPIFSPVLRNMFNCYSVVSDFYFDIGSLSSALMFYYSFSKDSMTSQDKDTFRQWIIALAILMEKMNILKDSLCRYKFDPTEYHTIQDVAALKQDSILGHFYSDDYKSYFDLVRAFYIKNKACFNDEDFDYIRSNLIDKIKEIERS